MRFSPVHHFFAALVSCGLCCLALLLSWTTRALAETTPTSEPFDLSATNLPPHYAGHSFQTVQQALQRRVSRRTPEKDTFETTPQYQERLKAWQLEAQSAPLFGSVQLDSPIALVCSCFTFYDADTQQFTAYQPIIGNSIQMSSMTTDGATYSAQNAFGAQVDVTERQSTSYYLSVLNLGIFPLKDIPKTIFGSGPVVYRGLMHTARFDIPEAKALSRELASLWIVRLKPPYIQSSESELKPTLSRPVRSTFVRTSLLVDALEVWFFRTTSGEVLCRFNARPWEKADIYGEATTAGQSFCLTKVDSPFASYDRRVVSRVFSNWRLVDNNPIYSQGDHGIVEVSFKILPNGRISDVAVLSSSSDEMRTRRCLEAVSKSVPFEPCPGQLRSQFDPARVASIKFHYSQKHLQNCPD